jgi:rhodanese-related sulfurtransferase
MKRICFLISSVLISVTGFAQYKNDNVLYKTVFMEDLCNEINSHPGLLLLDVRTPGEYLDTTTRGMSYGRFKNAVNIEVSELGKRIAEISDKKDKPVFVYCSHSQRSRRASKMLVDSGFTQVYNINAGMTGLRQLPEPANACLYNKLELNTSYKIVSAAELCNKISKADKNIFLLDVRDDSAFRHISLDERNNAIGYFKNSTNIPLASLEANISKIPTGKEIIITDLFGGDAARAAEILDRHNHKNVSVLLEGMYRLLNTNRKKLSCLSTAYVSTLPYTIINAEELKGFVATTKDYVFVDARTTEEFTNTHKNNWQNLGHLKDAINIPAGDIEKQLAKIEAYKTRPLIVYVFSGNREGYEAAAKLANLGFTKVMFLQGGIFNVGWTAANIKGFASLAGLRVNIPAVD